ncbi:hypothetical protein L7F22_017092 [Adiantum nelumboides]|nr:hypothetical protein [Adiantum nelumboides]
MEGYLMQQHPESFSQDMHALGQQPGISMFSRLKETLSRVTRSEHATNEINEGGGEVHSPFTSQIDPILSESVHVSTPATTPIGFSKLTPSETLLPDGRSFAEVQEVERYILAAREKKIERLRKAEQRSSKDSLCCCEEVGEFWGGHSPPLLCLRGPISSPGSSLLKQSCRAATKRGSTEMLMVQKV